MATPQSTTSYEGSGPKKLEQITFRFCSECSNMLYPKEDEDAHKLQFTCRTCQYTEEAQSTCVFRNVLNNSAGETAGVTQDVGSDPTVSDVPLVLCLGCGCLIFCDTCGEVATDVTAKVIEVQPDEMAGNEESMRPQNQFQFVPWSESDDPFAEYDEELMEDLEDLEDLENDLPSPALTDSTSDSTLDSTFSDDGAMTITI